jgi:hypothetical protein
MPSAKTLFTTAAVALLVVVAHESYKGGKLPLPKLSR